MKLSLPLVLALTASVASAQAPFCFDTNYGTALTLGDDTFSAVLPLGFTFNFGGASYTDVQVCSNGFLTFGSGSPGAADFTPTVAELIGNPEARLAGLWCDLNPGQSGTVWYNAVPAAGANPAYFTVTFDQVPFWGTTNPATFQMVLIAGDHVQLHFESDCAAIGGAWVVGASPGNGALANPVSFASLPIVTAGNATLHENGVGGFAYGGATHGWTADGVGGFIVTGNNQCADKNSYGSGCVAQYSTAYEYFAAATSFDLSNTAITGINTGTGYLITSSTAAYMPPSATATNLGLGDDSETTVTPSIPFAFPAGVATSFQVCSNGWVSANGSNGTAYNPDVAAWLGWGNPAWSCWHDYNTTAGGTIWAEEINGVLYVTWDAVVSYGTTNPSTFQFQFDLNSGIFHIVWQTMDNLGTSTTGDDYICGYTTGNGAADPGSSDLSSVAAGNTALVTYANDVLPLTLSADAPPVVNTSINLVTDNIPTTAAFGGVLLGLTQYNPGISLGGFGMPDCYQYNDQVIVLLFFPNGATSTSTPFAVPNVSGLDLEAQAAVYDPVGMPTPLGGLSSNGVQLHLGQ